MNEKNKYQVEYLLRYANEVLGNIEQFSPNSQEEKDDMIRLLGWLNKSLEDLELFLERKYDILMVAMIRIRIRKLVNSF